MSTYVRWAELLPSSIEVCVVQLPGHDRRLKEEPFKDLESLIDAVAQGLGPDLTTPFAFFGHSMGALIAYELVRFLRRHGGPDAEHLIVSGRQAPQIPVKESPLHVLPDREFLEGILTRYGGIPQAILREPQLMQMFMPILRADFTIIENYIWIPEDPIEIPITAVSGQADLRVTRTDLSAWQELTSGSFNMAISQGDHFYFRESPTLLMRLIANLISHR